MPCSDSEHTICGFAQMNTLWEKAPGQKSYQTGHFPHQFDGQEHSEHSLKYILCMLPENNVIISSSAQHQQLGYSLDICLFFLTTFNVETIELKPRRVSTKDALISVNLQYVNPGYSDY